MANYKDIKYDFSGENLTGLTAGQIPNLATSKTTSGTFADARISASSVTQHATTYDDTDLRSDIMTLALKEAITENRIAYNLPNAMIEQFQDDGKIGTETTGDRNASEYWSTISLGENTANYSSDANTKLLLHFDGNFTDSGNTGHTMTPVNIVTPAATAKLGTYSAYFDGASDFLTVPDHTDWFFDTNDFTIDFWVKFNSFTHHSHSTNCIWFQGTNSADFVQVAVDYTSGTGLASLGFLSYTSGAYRISVRTPAGSITTGSWMHLAIVRSGNTWYMFKDGVELTKTLVSGSYSNSIPNIAAIGNVGEVTYDVGNRNPQCWLDELRISNNARWTSNWNVADTLNATGTLISTAQTANAAQTKVSGVILYKNEEGTATLGTDLKIYFTCNGGTNWTESTPTAAGTFSSGILMAKCPEVTCTSGTDIRYKAVWANQSAGSKETQLHGIGMNY